jgi:hypothetical protein
MTIHINDKLVFFAAGCGVGVILGALFASQAGSKTIHDLSAAVEDVAQRVQQKFQSAGAMTAGETWQRLVHGRNVAAFRHRAEQRDREES